MNPFMMGLLGMTGASNPDLFSSFMAATGVSPDGMSMDSGMQAFPGMTPQDPLGGYITGSALAPGSEADAMADPSGGMMKLGGPAIQQLLGAGAGLGGVKTPGPTTPIMNAGVSGSQKAPEMSVKQGDGALASAIMRLISGGGTQDPLRVPALGSLIQGGI
jgi:hypothetical protein